MPPNDRQGEGLDADTLGGETREAFKASGFGKRLQAYSNRAGNARQYSRYLRQQKEPVLAAALERCGNQLLFHDYFTIGELRLAQIMTCKKHLLCPLCAALRAAKSVRVYSAKVAELLRADPLLRPYLVTFTVRNGPDLAERFRHLSGCLRAYHKRRMGTRQTGEVRKASAAVWSYEFTNRGRGWHPHVHAIWLCREAPDELRLRAEWEALTRDSFECDVTPMDPADPIGAFLEVFKYAVKFADLEDGHRLHAFNTLRGLRLQGSFGALRGLVVEPGGADELLDDLPFLERLFRYLPGQGYRESLLEHQP
ncbi:MAG: hypothetical protein WA797_06255 [Acidimicrobiales bacterium]